MFYTIYVKYDIYQFIILAVGLDIKWGPVSGITTPDFGEG